MFNFVRTLLEIVSVLKKAVLTASTLQISELFSHLQCALKRVILQVILSVL